MPNFAYRAVANTGESIKGNLYAEDYEQLENIISGRGLVLLNFHEQKATVNTFGKLQASVKDTLLFTVFLATGLKAGLPLVSVIEDMAEETPQGYFKKMLLDIKINVEAGNSLSSALSLFPNSFDEIYRIIIHTGEESGQLAEIFQYLVVLIEWEKELKKKLKGAVMPIIGIMTMLGGLFVAALTLMLPNFVPMFMSAGVELPESTKFLIATGDFLDQNWLYLLLSFFGFITAMKLFLRIPYGRFMFDSAKLKIPILGPTLQKIGISRFTHFWKLLFTSGVDLVKTLEIVGGVVKNKKLENAILQAREAIMNGQEMTTAFKDTKVFPGLVLRMINLGETTGNLEEALEKVSEYYDKEVNEAINMLISAIKPITLFLAAGLIILIGMGIILPMFGMIETIG